MKICIPKKDPALYQNPQPKRNSFLKAQNVIKCHWDIKKQGDLRNYLVLQGVTPFWQVAQWVSRAPPHHTLPAFLDLNGMKSHNENLIINKNFSLIFVHPFLTLCSKTLFLFFVINFEIRKNKMYFFKIYINIFKCSRIFGYLSSFQQIAGW